MMADRGPFILATEKISFFFTIFAAENTDTVVQVSNSIFLLAINADRLKELNQYKIK